MRRFEETIVQDYEVDSLGHMNVHFHEMRAHEAAVTLLKGFGVDAERIAAQGGKLTHDDMFNRYHREQFSGARLAVQGGVADANEDGVKLYLEVLNTEKDEIASTFIWGYQQINARTRAPIHLQPETVAACKAARIEIPAHG
ncbi:MAG: thioesterase family protein, partial [Caulobacterales bacterium]